MDDLLEAALPEAERHLAALRDDPLARARRARHTATRVEAAMPARDLAAYLESLRDGRLLYTHADK